MNCRDFAIVRAPTTRDGGDACRTPPGNARRATLYYYFKRLFNGALHG